MNHNYGGKIPIPSYDRIYYRQCRNCNSILLVVKTRDFNQKRLLYTINDKIYYYIGMEDMHVVPKGDLAKRCSIVNYTPNICHSIGRELPNVCYIKKPYEDEWFLKNVKYHLGKMKKQNTHGYKLTISINFANIAACCICGLNFHELQE